MREAVGTVEGAGRRADLRLLVGGQPTRRIEAVGLSGLRALFLHRRKARRDHRPRQVRFLRQSLDQGDRRGVRHRRSRTLLARRLAVTRRFTDFGEAWTMNKLFLSLLMASASSAAYAAAA